MDEQSMNPEPDSETEIVFWDVAKQIKSIGDQFSELGDATFSRQLAELSERLFKASDFTVRMSKLPWR